MPTRMSLVERRIVTIGGGSGGFIVNRGLKRYPVHPTAVCTVFDSGGSTGRLLDEFGSLPQGDIRRCILALANDEEETLRDIFNHRFAQNGSGLSKHNVGNVLLLAAEQLWGPVEGIRRISKLLGTYGDVLPISVDHATLVAELSDGLQLEGEAAIDTRSFDDVRTIVKVSLKPLAYICREASDAIRNADLIILGPGDLYTSLIPNFLVQGVAESIQKSSAHLVFIINAVTKYVETDGFSAGDFLKTVLSYGIGRETFDAVLINSAPIPQDVLQVYAEKEKAQPVSIDESIVRSYTKDLVFGDFLSEEGLKQKLIRHDSAKLARTLVEL